MRYSTLYIKKVFILIQTYLEKHFRKKNLIP